MRLGQLARKLAVIPAEIVEFLAANNIRIDESTNTRLEHEQLMVVVNHFAPARAAEFVTPVKEETQDIPEDTTQQVEIVEPETVEPEPVIPTPDIQQEMAIIDDDNIIPDVEQEPKVEVIKAPKVELAGLKVLGKIELPGPKKKEQKSETESTEATATTATPGAEGKDNALGDQRREAGEGREGKRKSHHKSDRTSDQRNKRARKNPIALQREREAYEAQLKREADAKSEKERRTLYYQNRVKASVPTKPARLINEQVVEMTADMAKTPTTWLGKFWKWFRS